MPTQDFSKWERWEAGSQRVICRPFSGTAVPPALRWVPCLFTSLDPDSDFQFPRGTSVLCPLSLCTCCSLCCSTLLPLVIFLAAQSSLWDLSSPTSPAQALNLCPLQWKRGVLTPGPPGNSLLPSAFKITVTKFFLRHLNYVCTIHVS